MSAGVGVALPFSRVYGAVWVRAEFPCVLSEDGAEDALKLSELPSIKSELPTFSVTTDATTLEFA